MKTKWIFWNTSKTKDGKTECEVHFFVGYNPASLGDYNTMATELRETFPGAKDEEIGVGMIRNTADRSGHTIIVWKTFLDRGEYAGWTQFENERVPYDWAPFPGRTK